MSDHEHQEIPDLHEIQEDMQSIHDARIVPRWVRLARWAAVLVVVVAIVALARSGVYKGLTIEGVRQRIDAYGALGPVVFLAAFALLQPLGLSAHAFTIGAALIWPTPIAFLLSWAGTVGASITSFVFSRFVARDWAQARLPARVRRWEEHLVTRPFRTVLLLRLLFYTAPPVQLMLGASRVPFRAWLPATALGMAPTALAVTVLGQWLIARFGWAP